MHLENRQTNECPSGGVFYRCSFQDYAGCCLVDACTSGCPEGKERPLKASLTATSSSTTSSTPTTSVFSSTLETIASVTDGSTTFITTTVRVGASASKPASNSAEATAGASSNGEHSKGNGTPLGAIIGGVIGGVALLLALLLLLFFLRRRKRVREQRRATLPPPYRDSGDMSEQLGAGTTLTSHSKTKPVTVSDDTAAAESTPQLDGTPIIPSVEANVDVVGNIPELPTATSPSRRNSDPFSTPDSSISSSRGERPRADPNNHVMSWSQFNSLGKREPSSRLSQPHTAPDTTTSVWGNMSPKTKSSK